MGHLIIPVILTTLVLSGHAIDQTTIYSAHPQRPFLCPGEPRPTFSCFTLGNDLRWNANGSTLTYNLYAPAGSNRTRNGFKATLLSVSDHHGTDLRSSVLTIPETAPVGLLTVQCSNVVSSTKTIKYQHTIVAGSPSEPVIVTNFSDPSSIKRADISGVPHVVLDMSWMQQPHIDRYEIQIDSNPLVILHSSKLRFMTVMESSFDYHTVSLNAVGLCGEERNTSINVSAVHLRDVVTTAAPTAAPTIPWPSTSTCVNVDGLSTTRIDRQVATNGDCGFNTQHTITILLLIFLSCSS